jgi:hypothetical protein
MKCSALVFLLVPFLAFAGPKGESIEKKINRQFSIQSNGQLTIDNKYGDVDIAIGESNLIKFDITIIVTAGNEKKAQEQLDRISVDFHEGSNSVEAVTDIESSSSWLSWFDTGNHEIEINYSVQVPKDIYLNLMNKFGSIYVESTDRDATIDLSYGEIRLGDINSNLTLNMAYSEGSLSQIKQGHFDLSYSEIEMENSQSLNVEMQYTDLVMGSANQLNVVSSYGDLKGMDIETVSYSGKYDDVHFDRVKTIDADCGYTDIHLDGLTYSGTFDMRYGDLIVANIANGFKRIDIRTNYAGVDLEFSPVASYTIDAQTNYCDINYNDDLKVSERIERESSTTLKGSKGNGGGQVVAVMTYGELTIE